MVTSKGTPTLADVAIGRIKYYPTVRPLLPAARKQSVEEEQRRLSQACVQTEKRLAELYQKALREAGRKEAAILEVHQMLLEDVDFQAAVQEWLKTGCSAEYAVQQAGEQIAQTFDRMDGYMQARAADIRDVSAQLIRSLSGSGERKLTSPVILMADDLSPSATIQLDRKMLLGFVTRGGSVNSHTAILSRTMGIPALVQTPIQPEWDGAMAVLDGRSGTLYIDPDPETLAAMEEAKEQIQRRRQQLQALRGVPAVTKDGRQIFTYANINSLQEAQQALDNDAQGIGLFRSEFLYLDRDYLPSEEEQFQVYRQVLELMGPRRVVIRTLDIGSDKTADYFHLDREENPALGYRGIRICLDRPDLFRTQVRALLRASVYGNLSILYPMISSLEEVLEAKSVVLSVCQELRGQNIPCAQVRQGIMIETPAAAILSDQLAPHVDFFSIGTNDLTQYTLASDRKNPKMTRYYNPHHPAVLRLIQQTVEAGHKAGIRVGICGELGADLTLTEQFLRMGVDTLSVAPSSILTLRNQVRSLDLSQAEA